MEEGRRNELGVARERAILVACLLPGHQADPQDPLGELRSLADTAGAVVVDELLQKKQRRASGTLIGSGKVNELAAMVKTHEADVIIFDNDLNPAQISNIEEVVQVKVLDRSELILDIFAARARTVEARLQVELAQLEYTYPRLRAMWTHLERIVGGAPTGIGTRGPGEQQLEIDRRIVQRRISELKQRILELQARRQREVEARNREFFTVGLVGYTNAGKSTLFNTLTDGGAYADDKLFATLSTRTRKWDLGNGDLALISDTVGFIRDLPHHLVASFKATLQEAVHSDLLLLVLDVAHPRHRHQLETVTRVLDDIGATQQKRILVLNKTDLLEHNADLLVLTQEFPGAVSISARTGRGLDVLADRIREELRGGTRTVRVGIPLNHGRAIQFLETHSEVLDRQYQPDHAAFDVRIGVRQLEQLRSLGGRLSIDDLPPAESSTP